MTNKDENTYSVSEAISALLTELEKMEIDFDRDSIIYAYEKDEGQTVSIITDDIPDFEIGEDMLIISEFEWIVQRIGQNADGDYVTTFLLEDAI